MKTESKQPVNDVVSLPATTLRRIITQHYKGSPDIIQSVAGLPEDMQPILIQIFDYLLKTMGFDFLKTPSDDWTPEQTMAHLMIAKIDILSPFIAECPDWFNPVISSAVSLGIDLMRLAETDPSNQIVKIIRNLESTLVDASSRGARIGAKTGVSDEFRRRDKKTRPNSDNIRTGQYDAENWREAFEEVRRLMKVPGARIGKVLAAVRKSKRMTKVTEDRFRRKWYEEQKRTWKPRSVK